MNNTWNPSRKPPEWKKRQRHRKNSKRTRKVCEQGRTEGKTKQSTKRPVKLDHPKLEDENIGIETDEYKREMKRKIDHRNARQEEKNAKAHTSKRRMRHRR